MVKNKSRGVVIAGPTSSGKTELSLKLAKEFNGIIISADSRQIYIDLDIATAKINQAQKKDIPHYLIDIVKPTDDFTVLNYQDLVRKILLDIHAKNQSLSKPIIPFIVGGTGLYIKSIVDNYQLGDVQPNKALRKSLEKLSDKELYQNLLILNPKTDIDSKNRRRLIRAIEVLKSSSISVPKDPLPFNFLQIGIDIPREKLYNKIDEKVEEMIKLGLVNETKQLILKNYDFDIPALSALGYKQIKDFLESKLTLKDAISQIQQQTRNYAKRQLTWFKTDKRIQWIKNHSEAKLLIQNFLK